MESKKTRNRSSFSGQVGFILAAAGSAIGLGNIWRFPYLAAQYGGGIFLLCYFVLLITFGFTLMIAEVAIGRKTNLSVIGAFRALDKRFSFLGVLASIVPMIILPYYSVIGGWVAKYFVVFVSGNSSLATDSEFFFSFIGGTWEPVSWLFLFVAITSVIVFFGVEKGIEKANKILMPFLIILVLVITIYSITLPGAWEGVIYYIKPDFSKFSINTVVAAMGQLFYSMSLAMGIMVTYGSYLNKSTNLEKSIKHIEIFDTGIAFLAGLMIVPAVFAFSGGDEEAINAGVGLMFLTLPNVFTSMNFGAVFGSIFFLLVVFAALTSTISLMETIVSIFQDKFKWSRKFTCVFVGILCFVLGIPSSLGFGIWENIAPLGMSLLDFFDFISNSVLMPIVAFITCIFVGYIIKPKAIIDEVSISSTFKKASLFSFMIRYIAPIFLIVILASKLIEVL